MTKEKKTKKKKSKNYFTLDTQNKIIEYQNTDDLDVRSVLYEHHIYPAFTELVHNLVSVYKFKSLNEDILIVILLNSAVVILKPLYIIFT